MKEIIALTIASLLSTSAMAIDNAKYKGKWYTVPYDLTTSVDSNPIDWARYERDVTKWRDTFNNLKDGKANTLKRMVSQSPGCVLVNGKGDHLKVYSTIYDTSNKWNKPLVLAKSNIGGFSDNRTGSADGDRKTAYDDIWAACGVIYGTAGKTCIDIYGVSLCSPF